MRITIYVPDDRAADIERHRENMNFSQVFMEAFDKQIAMKSNPKLGAKDMQTVIERLKRGVSESFEQGSKAGFEVGVECAKDELQIGEIRCILQCGEDADEIRGRLEQWDAYFDRDFWHNLEKEADSFSDPSCWHDSWFLGFRAGVESVWEQIKGAF